MDSANEMYLEDVVADADGKTSVENFSVQSDGSAIEDVIVVNEYSEMILADYSRINYSLENYQVLMKNPEQVEEYYGRSLELTELPEDIIPMPIE